MAAALFVAGPASLSPPASALASLREAAAAQAAEYTSVYGLLCSHGRELGLAECKLTDVAFGIQSLLRLQPLIEQRTGDEARAEAPGGEAWPDEPSPRARRRRGLRLPQWLPPLRWLPLWRGEPARAVAGVPPSLARTVSLPRALRCLDLSHAAYGPLGVLLVAASRGEGAAFARTLAGRAAWRRPNEAAFEAMTNLSARICLLHAQWSPTGSTHDGAYVPAHYITVDPVLKAVVLVVRGSFGLRDAFVDLRTASASPDLERHLGRGCHGGIAAAAWALVAMHTPRLRGELEKRPGWQLIITGHSLGGGVASFAAKLLRDSLPRHTSVSAIVFAPLATLPLSECAPYDRLVDSFICGADIVPRLSIGSLRHLIEMGNIAAGVLRDQSGESLIGSKLTAAATRGASALIASPPAFPSTAPNLSPAGAPTSSDAPTAVAAPTAPPSALRHHTASHRGNPASAAVAAAAAASHATSTGASHAAASAANAAASAAAVATSAASSAAISASSAASAALDKLMQRRDVKRQRKQEARRASAVAAQIRKRVTHPHQATVFPAGRLLMLTRVAPAGGSGTARHPHEGGKGQAAKRGLLGRAAAGDEATSQEGGRGRAGKALPDEAGGRTAKHATPSHVAAEAPGLPRPHRQRGARREVEPLNSRERRGRGQRDQSTAGGGRTVDSGNGQGGDDAPWINGREALSSAPEIAARSDVGARGAMAISSAAAAVEGTEPPSSGAGGSAGGWRLQAYDRREMAVLDVRPSMLRDHGFDRYDVALRAVQAGAAGGGGQD